jgi:hypothetical protein
MGLLALILGFVYGGILLVLTPLQLYGPVRGLAMPCDGFLCDLLLPGRLEAHWMNWIDPTSNWTSVE